ncbi:membrane bound O-acyl transferase family-domain-containing protein [Mycena floridula]|nr:membrane bound O-acyl transferase family-domain-containing protein [Mycena floridula]
MSLLAPFPNWLLPSYLILSFVPLFVRSSSCRRLFFIPITATTYYFLFHTTTGNITSDYGIACGWLTLFFISSDFILLTDVQNELRSVKPPQDKPVSQEGLWIRFNWAWDLFTSPRGVGWTHEPTVVLPPRPKRHKFVIKQLARVAVLGVIFDLANWHNQYNPAYFRDGPSLTAYGWFWRYESIWGWVVQGYATMAIQNCFVSIMSVSLGRSDAEDWPWLFGSFLDAWTIRRFWGRTWHQILRRFVTAHGRFLSSRILGLARGTNLSAYVQLYTAFLLSATIHYLADYTVLRNWSGGGLKFFISQPLAITIEDGVIALGQRFGIKGSSLLWRLLGYAWVWTWFAPVFPTWQDPLMTAGMMSEGANKSLIQTAWNSLYANHTALAG